MDYTTTTLATGIVAALLPFVTKGGEEISKSIGKDVYEKGKKVLSTLKERWTGDKAAEIALSGFEEDPDTFRPTFHNILKKRLLEDEDLALILKDLIHDEGVNLTVIQKIKDAEDITGVATEEIQRGTINVGQEADKAQNVIGIKADRIG